MDSSVKLKIINLLKTLPVCKPTSNHKNWVIRCPYCGDSKTANHGHFSILIDINSNTPIIYRCFRCNESGILTNSTLEDLGIYLSSDIKNSLIYYNKYSSRNRISNNEPKNYKIPSWSLCANNLKKLLYINTRLGTSLTLEDCINYKIILSIKEFLEYNKIYYNQENHAMLKSKTIEELENNYVGFLSSNNNKITFRDISNNGFFGRYYKITLDLYNNSTNTFYALDAQYDLLYTDSIHVHITEGTFDILGVYLNINHNHLQNNLFLASCGFGFTRILKFLIYKGVTTNIILHVYADADKSDKEILNTFNNEFYNIWIDSIIIHRNIISGEKDYGVAKDRINDFSYKIK